MNKKKMIARLTILLVFLIGVYFEMSTWAPNRVGARNIVIESEEIPASFNNVSIAIISDINSSVDNLAKAKRHYDKMHPDVLVFTGDLFEEPADDELSGRIKELLSNMEAPLGKFAILSPNDIESSRQLLVESGFTVLSNSSFAFYNQTNESIQVNFYDSNDAARFPKGSKYTIGFAYDANTFDTIKEDNIDVFVGGKTLGGGINLPFIGSLKFKGYTKSSSLQGNTQLLVSHGIGTPGDDYRLFSSPELLVLSLNHKLEEPVQETPQPETTEPDATEAQDTTAPEETQDDES